MCEDKRLKRNNYTGVKELIDELCNKFKFDLDFYELYFKFRELSEKESKIYGVYDNFGFGDPEAHRFKLFWSSWRLDIDKVLVRILKMYPCFGHENLNKDVVTREDKIYCEDLVKLIDSEEYKVLDSFFPCEANVYSTARKNCLNKIIEVANQKEYEYEITTDLVLNKIEEFENIIFDNAIEKNEIINLLPEDKIKFSNKVAKKYIRIDEQIPRSLFFNNVYGHENFAYAYVEKLKNIKAKAIVNYLKNNAKIVKNINEALNKFDNINDIIIITSFDLLNSIFKYQNYYEYKGVNIPVIEFNQKGILIFDKNSLPEIEYMEFDSKETADGKIKKHTYMEIIDYSKVEDVDDEKKKSCGLKIAQSVKLNKAKIKNIYYIEDK